MIQNLKTLLRIVKVTKNLAKVMFVKLGFKSEGLVIFRNGYEFKLHKNNWIEFMQRVNFFRVHPDAEITGDKAVKLKYKSRNLIYYFGEWGPNLAGEMFSKEPYKKFLEEFDITGKVAVDVGVNAGDSAIYFALWGAKKVYAFEPFPGFYNLAEKNVKANGLADVCTVVNAGVGGKAGFFIEDPTYKHLGFNQDPMLDTLFEGRVPDAKIPIVTLHDIVLRFRIDGAFLKVDCEGYEYDIILNASKETLRHFDYIVVEYHYGFDRLEKKLLEAGFAVGHTEPENSYLDRPAENHNFSVGYVSGRRI